MCGLFPCIPILGVFIFDQRYYGKGGLNFCVKPLCWVAAKHATSKVLKQIKPNLDGLSRGSFLPPVLQRDYEFEKLYLHLNSHTYLVYTTSLTDLCFNKKFEQEKKSLYKSISKSIYIDTYVDIICNNRNWMCCLFTFNEIFLLISQKGGGTASVNYLKGKNDVTYWKTNPRCSKLFAFK